MLIQNCKKDYNPTDKLVIGVADKEKLATQYSLQSDWQFRIYAQMLYRSSQCDYNIYFFTLTFKEKYLPVFRYKEYECPCFDHDLINKFCRACQMDLLRMYNCTDYDYIICSEFGKQATFRAHHHGSFMVHKSVPPLAVHRIIKKNWSVLTGTYKRNGAPVRDSIGWVLPDRVKGWKDKKGVVHSDFQVKPENIDSCAIYLSKYCTKQVGWFMNASVGDTMKAITDNHDRDALDRFNKVKPKLKTSLHFGECINEWILGKNVPPAVSVDSDYRHNIFYGILTPLCRKSYTKIPFYNIRKLMYSKIEEYVEKIYRYCENEYYSYDIFDADIFRGLRPLTIKSSYRYKWDTVISEFWVDYMPYEYEHKIKSIVDKVSNAKCWQADSIFNKWLKIRLNQDQYDYVNQLLKSIDPESLAIYVAVYQWRCSPLHLYSYLENPDLFKDSINIEEYTATLYDRYGKKSYDLLIEEYQHTYYQYVTTYVDTDVELDASLAEVQRPFYSGRETLEQMKSSALDFYLSRAKYCSRSYYSTCKPDTFNVLFNSFPCFRGYDLLYSIIQDFFCETQEKKLKVIQEKFEKKSKLKNQMYE